ncbi:Uncharacterized protein dnm_008980 [Desulfonema magnum]|uniref:Uncharacterized protein n=1 Tax=Desulfonema magnum TaxID=45655 RepID=A0A975BH15_9BACT|nr:Uncharacterized protein dnm_008980 [Desulfonema magnum]
MKRNQLAISAGAGEAILSKSDSKLNDFQDIFKNVRKNPFIKALPDTFINQGE